jgi:mannose/fructose-specific phosphotransferase system component IIA
MSAPMVVLVGHGALPTGMRDAAEVILGELPRLHALELPPEQTPEGLRAELARVLDGGGAAVVLADVFGGTPHNVAAVEASMRDDVELLTGMNLPMLVEVLTSRATDAAELAEVALHAGRGGVMHVSLMSRATDG